MERASELRLVDALCWLKRSTVAPWHAIINEYTQTITIILSYLTCQTKGPPLLQNQPSKRPHS